MKSILLVDDDTHLLNGLRRSLRDQPYDLFIATSGEMAMDMFRRRSFDLVVVDQNMHGMKGTELVAWLSREFPETVRIMLTGHIEPDVMLSAINEGGVFRFLAKPCSEMDLALAIIDGLVSHAVTQTSIIRRTSSCGAEGVLS